MSWPQLSGLQLIVADSVATGTVGGIDRATWSFWKNITFDATTDGPAAATAANIQGYMNRVWVQLARGRDKPDIILADNNYYSLYWNSLQNIQRVVDGSGKLGAAFMHGEGDGSRFLGPAALNRAWTLVNDVRDTQRTERLRAVAGDAGCHSCHTQGSCTERCPKHLEPTRAIAGLKRMVGRAAAKGEL